VAEATPLNRDAARYSADIDVFHDRQERVSQAAVSDVVALEAGGIRCGVASTTALDLQGRSGER
jgi:hypothetical protein